MSIDRKPAEGVLNILRFNWPYFAWSGAGAFLLVGLALAGPVWFARPAALALVILAFAISIPLLVSFYLYDFSGLYRMTFLDDRAPAKIVNLTAGFDEITPILRAKFPHAEILTCDFFDPKRHREPSIQRARSLFPPQPGTLSISTSHLPLPDEETDLVVGFLSLHEIRDEKERVRFLIEARRVLAPQGTIIVVEHLRDLPNLLAYSIGFLHFHSERTWRKAFAKAGLHLSREQKLTPFLSLYELTPP